MDHLRFERTTQASASFRRSALAVLLATASGFAGRSTRAAKQKGPACGERASQRCSSDVETCRAMMAGFCQGQAGCLAAAACCDSCSAEGMFTCLLALQEMTAARLVFRENGDRHA